MNAYELTLGIVTLVFSCIVTPLMVYFLNKKTNAKVATVDKKMDDNHKLMNGHLKKLLRVTGLLATATEKAKHKIK